eukprot:TRINITY_DN645_c0_g1_i1.p1 TRINITY_DN645_c0_g1~~TRINITY_DN645_c0_g1_i1.p1  ORF type:complete len:807 (-),score=125.25 TRINITY_DN645_c0_g1_i1:130-2550(-)
MAMPNIASFKFYVFFSVFLSAAVFSHAVYTKRFFYRTVVYLSGSKLAIMCAANMALVSVLLIWRLTQLIFLGPLRFRELERLHHRARDTIIEYCFAISVFRDDFNTPFVALIMTLLMLKSLHWLAKDRTDYLEEQLRCPLRTHIRLVGLLTLLAFLDCFLATICIESTMQSNGRSMFVLFSFEFTLLFIELAANIFQYIFFLVDQRMDGRWASKGVFSFYAELLCDLSTLTIYIVFFIYVQIYYSFPYHIIREFYVTLSKFQRKCADFLRYRRVVANIHEVVEEVSEEELSEGDRTCIICREEMDSAIKLACGHMFHRRCLENWLKRQLSCPTCRATIDVNRGARNQDRSANQNANANQARAAAANAANAPAAQLHDANQPPQATQPANQAAQQNQQPVPGQHQRQPGGPNGAQHANIGEAGARLLNFANQWINQVMNDAGMVPQAHVPNANAAHANNVQPNLAHQPNQHQHQHQHQHQLHRQQRNQASILQARIRQAAQQRVQHMLRQNPHAMLNYPGVAGPNAIAHMQLRARRRGALNGLRQYAPGYGVNLPPLNNGMHAMYNAPNQDANMPNAGHTPASGTRDQGEMGTRGASSASGEPNSTRQGRSGSSSASGAGSSSDARGMASASGATAAGAEPRTPAAGESGQTAAASAAMHAGLGSQLGLGAGAQSLPLERLFEIQRQIEVLRSEVQSLVLHATEAQLRAMETEEQQAGDGDDGTNDAARTGADIEGSSGEGGAVCTRDENVVDGGAAGEEAEAPQWVEERETSTRESGNEEGGEEADSEADRIRRRRIEFLERTSRS